MKKTSQNRGAETGFAGRTGSAPSQSTINKRLRELRKLIDDPNEDEVAKRVAWSVEQAIRWARSHTVGWPKPADDARGTAKLIRRDLGAQNGRDQRRPAPDTKPNL